MDQTYIEIIVEEIFDHHKVPLIGTKDEYGEIKEAIIDDIVYCKRELDVEIYLDNMSYDYGIDFLGKRKVIASDLYAAMLLESEYTGEITQTTNTNRGYLPNSSDKKKINKVIEKKIEKKKITFWDFLDI
jgi:hypothetical protein